MPDFKDHCTGCGACAAACPFLEAYGEPKKILSEHPEAAFYCTSCHQCDGLCPVALSPAAAFFEAKQKLLKTGQIPDPVRKGLESARGFAKAGHGFPFVFYEKAETVFWPGCGLSANQPDLISKLRTILSRRLQQRIGLILDCCFDPVFEYGDTETAFTALQDISKRLRDNGVKRVITGCLNCYKLLAQHLDGPEVVFILDLIPPEAFGNMPQGPMYLHHPCPSSRWDSIREKAGIIIRQAQASQGTTEKSVPHIKISEALCCGSGGGLSSISPPLADRFLDRIVQEGNGQIIITYCFGCRNRFLKRGVAAVHILETLTHKSSEESARRMPSSQSQWFNRFALAMTARMKTGKFLIGLLIALFIVSGIYLNQQQLFSSKALLDLLGRYPVLAPLLFLGIYAVAPALFLPSIPLTLAAGFFWGPLWGVVFSMSGATIGACLPFFLARYLFQRGIKSKIPVERWQWLQDKVSHHGWKAVAFTRLIPVFPFNLLNYLFGLTPIPFRQYLWSTFVFMLPACIAFVAFGSSLGELIIRGNVQGVIIGIIVAILALLLAVILKPLFRKIGDSEAAVPENQQKKENETERAFKDG